MRIATPAAVMSTAASNTTGGWTTNDSGGKWTPTMISTVGRAEGVESRAG